MKLKKVLIATGCCLLLFIVSIVSLDYWISYKTAPYIYTNYEQLPPRSIGIVLGTSKYIPRGGINPYYRNRIIGAIKLYQHNKIHYLLVSGDNTFKSYNEPKMMQQDLIKAKIPHDVIYLDFAGFRTLDSIIRASKIFNADDFTIITQQFHCERAIFIAITNDIKAQCYAVADPENIILIRIREMFARVMAYLDIYLLDKEPKLLGPATPIISDNETENQLLQKSSRH